MKHKGLVELLIGVPLIVNSVMPFSTNIAYAGEERMAYQYSSKDNSNLGCIGVIPDLKESSKVILLPKIDISDFQKDSPDQRYPNTKTDLDIKY